MIEAFYNEATVKVGDDTLRLVINFAALDLAESLTGRAFDDILKDLTSSKRKPPAGLQIKVLWSLLREHHSDLTLDQASWLVLNSGHGPALGIALGGLINAAFPKVDAKGAGSNPQ